MKTFIFGTYLDISSDYTLDEDLFNKYTHVFLSSASFDKFGKLIFPIAFYHPIANKYISGMCARIFELKKKNRHIKVVLNIRASDDLMIFNKIISDNVFMDTMVESICDAIRNYGLDGIDIKWQHPVSGVKPERFAVFIKALKCRLLQIQMLHDYPTLLLCLTINPRMSSLEYYNLDLYDEYVDIFHLKGYDIDENWMKYVSHYNLSYHDLRESVRYINGLGTTTDKILIGVPFHGHMFEGTLGLDQIYKTSKMIPYQNIENKETATYNQEYGVACIYNKNICTYTSFEDETSIGNKIDYIKQSGLLGIISSETDNVLSNYISLSLPKEQSNNNIIYNTSDFTNISSPN